MYLATGHIHARALRWIKTVPGTCIAEPMPKVYLIIRRVREAYVFEGQSFDSFAAARAAAEARWARDLRNSMIVTLLPNAPDDLRFA